jgi:uncharacterized protein (TIGR02594 family)
VTAELLPRSVTPYSLAQRFIGMGEIAGDKDNGFITWCLTLCGIQDGHDEIPWCSAFLNGIFWMLRQPRSKSAAARSWLEVGVPIKLEDAVPGYDVVIIKRGDGAQPGPEVVSAQGHVFLFGGIDGAFVLGLGGNQNNQVSVARFGAASVLGVRRCYEVG